MPVPTLPVPTLPGPTVPVDPSSWMPWSEWSDCTDLVGCGSQSRMRMCGGGLMGPGSMCAGDPIENQQCGGGCEPGENMSERSSWVRRKLKTDRMNVRTVRKAVRKTRYSLLES